MTTASAQELDQLQLELESRIQTTDHRLHAAVKSVHQSMRHDPHTVPTIGWTSRLVASLRWRPQRRPATRSHLAFFSAGLMDALTHRQNAMRRELDQAEQCRQVDDHTTRQHRLEQAQQQWTWFQWILERQQAPPPTPDDACAYCGLHRHRLPQPYCASCTDRELLTAEQLLDDA